jgi:hypothetical protein
MRVVALAVAALLPLAPAGWAAPKDQPNAAGSAVRYFLLSGTFVGDVETDATLRETRQGAAVTSAVLDVCYGNATISNRKDRFAVDLTPSAGKLAGTGRTQVGNEPVSVQLIRTADGGKFTFEGTIKIGQAEYEVASPDNGDISEADFRDAQSLDEIIVPAPDTFAEPGPGTVAARVKLEALADFVKALKSENLRVRIETLQPDCQALRAGTIAVQAEIDPMRSAATVAKLRATPNVLLAGWTGGRFSPEYAVRISSADYGGANLDRNKLAAAIAASAAKALSATLETTSWDDPTGELTVRFTRPSLPYAGLALTDKIGLSFLIGPEKPGATDALIVWIGAVTIETVDEGAEPRLKLVKVPEGTPGSDNIDTAPVLPALVNDLKGRLWDPDSKSWKQP